MVAAVLCKIQYIVGVFSSQTQQYQILISVVNCYNQVNNTNSGELCNQDLIWNVMVDRVANLEIWTFILSVYRISSILQDYIWLDFLKISGKSSIRPNSKNHYLHGKKLWVVTGCWKQDATMLLEQHCSWLSTILFNIVDNIVELARNQV